MSVVRWLMSQWVRARVAPAMMAVITARVILRVRRGSGSLGYCGDRVIGCSWWSETKAEPAPACALRFRPLEGC